MTRRRFDPLVVFGVPAAGGGLVLPTLGDTWFVNGGHTGQFGRGTDFDHPLATIQAAHDGAAAGDLIMVAPYEYDEDVIVTKSKLTLLGCGPRGSIRITGTAAGTATAMTMTGTQDCGLYNLNLEGRTGGSGLKVTGQTRRLEIKGTKIGGNDQAILLDVPAGSQFVDVRVDDCVVADAAIGINVDYSGGDPGHKLVVRKTLFQKITTDCIKENGATHDYAIYGNIFAANDGTEPTRFLDIDETGTTGFVSDNSFHTTLLAASKFAIAAGVLWVNNKVQAELPGLAAYGTNGRPD